MYLLSDFFKARLRGDDAVVPPFSLRVFGVDNIRH